jgi:hypothetical protein
MKLFIRIISLILICTTVFSTTQAQKHRGGGIRGKDSRYVYVKVGPVMSVGFNYTELKICGDSLIFCGGNAAGVEMAVGYAFSQYVSAEADLGYSFFSKRQMVNDVGLDINFNKQYTLGTIKMSVPLSKKRHTCISFGGGTGLYFPNRCHYIEINGTEESPTDIYFSPTLGFHGVGELQFAFTDHIAVSTFVRYKALTLSANTVSFGSLANLPDGLKNYNENGLDMNLSVVFMF